MKKFMKLAICSLVVCLVTASAVILSACGEGTGTGKVRTVTNFTAERNNGAITLKWEQPENFDTAAYSGFVVIEVSKIDDQVTNIGSMSADDQELYKKRIETNYYYQYNFVGLPHGKTYTFSIRAEFTGGLLGNRMESGAVELSYTVPSAVNVYATFTMGEGLVVQWYKPTYDGGSPILRYEISKDGGETWEYTASAGATQTTLYGVAAYSAPNVKTPVRVRAVTAITELLDSGSAV
jgi:hypothetical protein